MVQYILNNDFIVDFVTPLLYTNTGCSLARILSRTKSLSNICLWLILRLLSARAGQCSHSLRFQRCAQPLEDLTGLFPHLFPACAISLFKLKTCPCPQRPCLLPFHLELAISLKTLLEAHSRVTSLELVTLKCDRTACLRRDHPQRPPCPGNVIKRLKLLAQAKRVSGSLQCLLGFALPQIRFGQQAVRL